MQKIHSLRPSIAAFLLMMAMSITSTALSFFVSPVCDALGIGRGSFTIYYSIMTAAGAFSTSFWGQHINRRGTRGLILLCGLWCAAGLMLFSFASSLWMFYLIGGLTGLTATSCVSLCANVIMQQSYSGDQAAGLLGIVMAGSGVGGMLFSMILPGMIETFGWQMGYRFLAVCWLVFVWSAFFILGKQKVEVSIGRASLPVDGMSRAEAMRSPDLYLLIAVIMILAACCGILQQIPSLLEGMGFSSGQVSAMVSFMTAALAVGKILQGGLCGKIGIRRGIYIMVAIFAVSFPMLMVKSIIYPALVALALGLGIPTTLMPTVTRFAFGAREFAAIWSMLATASSVGSFISTPLWGMVYDMTGTYTPALIVSSVSLVIALGALFLVFRKKDVR